MNSNNTNTNTGSSTNNSREVECRVCGDKASGKHYGVPSCDGCRGFFKRSIRRNLDYVCKQSGNCIVDVTRRNQCQSCRFRKCLQVNMKRDAVQHERAPRANGFSKSRLPFHFSSTTNPISGGLSTPNPSIYFPNPSSTIPTNLFKHNHHNSGNNPNTSIPSTIHGLYPSNPTFVSSQINTRFNISLFSPPQSQTRTVTLGSLESPGKEKASSSTSSNRGSEEEVSTTTNNEQLVPETFHHPFSSSLMHESVYESAAKLLFLSIKWARSVPSFGSLPPMDQALLLENSWSELFILSAVQWGLQLEDNFLIGKSTGHILSARKLLDVLTRVTSLNPDYTELACLKAVVLFKPEVLGLGSQLRIELYQDQTVLMLQEYCYAKFPLNKVRFGKLLLTFPYLKLIQPNDLEDLFFKQTVGDVSIQKLISDLVKSTF